ncbi:MAG: hypothetical protein SVU32_04975 [Candidatus Nanohaloarchaea archaeon]|nr:hypothetical protein [Candidatus Nanohaloarchaea archaeon]
MKQYICSVCGWISTGRIDIRPDTTRDCPQCGAAELQPRDGYTGDDQVTA